MSIYSFPAVLVSLYLMCTHISGSQTAAGHKMDFLSFAAIATEVKRNKIFSLGQMLTEVPQAS